MARVYLARAPGGAEVALKLLAREITGGALAARFAREVASAARLQHPGCVRLLDHGTTPDGVPYLVTEHLAGPTLRDALGHAVRLPIPEATSVARQLCRALAHAHGAGVLHRDIKPENAMYRRPGTSGEIVLIDFGLARLFDDAPLTAIGTCVGSPSYLAPERLLEQRADERADLYAIGVVLYEMLAGRPPFEGDTSIEIARQHIMAPPQPIQDIRPAVPAALAAIVHTALAKDPADRFRHAGTMAAALASVPPSAAEDSLVLEIPASWVSSSTTSDNSLQ
jgi:serine/threonine-protein kinase